MSTLRGAARLMAVLLAVPNVLFAQSAAPYAEVVTVPAYTEQIGQAQALIAAFMAERGVPGVSVAVAINDRIIWSQGFGYANVEHGIPVTPLTRFRSGSVAKPITAAAAALLYEKGKLDLDAPVQKYIPSFPDKGAAITARMLAGHLSGIRHYPLEANEFFNSKPYANLIDALEIFQNDPLLFKPGTKYSYSSYGINLLGAMVQVAAGTDFLTFLQTNVFEPLGMRSTSGDYGDKITPFRTSFYERTGAKPSYHTRQSSWGKGERGVLLNAPYTDNSNKYPSGGIVTTPEDLVRFGSAHLGPGFLKAETLKLLFTPQHTAAGEETTVGLVWQIRRDQGRRTYSHSGSSVGGNSFLLLYPDEKIVVAIQSNLTDSNFQDLPQRIARQFLPRTGSDLPNGKREPEANMRTPSFPLAGSR
jgi:serine beta-lactamase-like protein LACTB, mitochondrial